ncbi:MAG: hypothetical protein NT150_13020 [Bacteroidetes bacterium]|nr:hypothetical protein [Bacteroidota bacterium]
MKYFNKIALISSLFFGTQSFAQTSQKELLGVSYIDVQGIELSQNEITSIVRIEIEKLQKFEVVDRYEIDNYYKANGLDKNGCMSKSCVLKAGKELHLDFIVSGTVEKIGRMLAINLRQYNVKSGAQESTVMKEYIYEPLELQTLIRFSVETLFGVAVNPALENLYLFQKNEADLVEKPNVRKLNLSGPRFGLSFATGENSNILSRPKNKGGFDMAPMMTQFGYHTEARYLNTGNVMALIEFFGLVGGMEQQKFIPSLSIIHGFRLKKSRWEFGFGPTFNIQKRASGFYDENKNWHLEADKNLDSFKDTEQNIVERLDSRGSSQITSAWVFAIGKTFTSGTLNIPVNLYTIPSKEGWTVGVSMGWSLEKSK